MGIRQDPPPKKTKQITDLFEDLFKSFSRSFSHIPFLADMLVQGGVCLSNKLHRLRPIELALIIFLCTDPLEQLAEGHAFNSWM